MGRRGAVGFLHREEKSERGVDITPLQGARRSEGPRFFSFSPQHSQLALARWKMGTPTTSICGLILSLILSCQLVTVSERKLSLLPFSFSAFQRSPSGECFVFHSAAKVSCNRPKALGGQIRVTNQCCGVPLKAKKYIYISAHVFMLLFMLGKWCGLLLQSSSHSCGAAQPQSYQHAA